MPQGGDTGNGFDKRPHDRSPGRKKGARNISTRLRERLEAGESWGEVIEALYQKAKSGDTRAIELLFNRLEGLPRATILTGEVPKLIIRDYGSDETIPEPTEGDE